jgi:hypothetical protein
MTDTDRQRLAGILGMLGSDHAGERAAAALQAEAFRRRHGLTWAELLALPEPTPEPPEWTPPPPPETPAWTPPPPPAPAPVATAPFNWAPIQIGLGAMFWGCVAWAAIAAAFAALNLVH